MISDTGPWMIHNPFVPFHSWRLAEEPPSFSYDVLSNLIVPRPIAFLSTEGPRGPNLAPFSFFISGGPNPPSLALCIVRSKDGSKKASLVNLEHTPGFVVNLVDLAMAEGMNHTGVDYPDGDPKWGKSGFASLKSHVVSAARVAESPAQFECRVAQIVELGQSSYVIAEVLMAHVRQDLYDLDARKWTRFEPIARLGGSEYLDLACGKVFEMTRPVVLPPPSLDL